MSEQYSCPFCGYEAGTVGSVKGHITAKSDDAHAGKRGPDYTDEISDSVGSSEDSSADSTEQGTAGSSSSDTAGIVPESEQSSDSSSDDDGCPDCGEQEAFDADEYADAHSARLEDDHLDALDRGSWVCTSCGRVYA